MRPAPLVVVMGVSGVGKSTVAERLSAALSVPFVDGDDFHSAASIAAMAAGTPLTDADRWPWLERIGRWLASHDGGGAVTACSALKRSYRDALRAQAPSVWFLYLQGGREVVADRLVHRQGHFMPASLLTSQWEVLEPPGHDERAVAVDADQTPDEIVATFVDAIAAVDAAGSDRRDDV